jgi:enamine deaminase RidA (YjgF/YER057c/UK114 family)
MKNIIDGDEDPKPAEPPARNTSTIKAFPAGVLIEIDAIALKI